MHCTIAAYGVALTSREVAPEKRYSCEAVAARTTMRWAWGKDPTISI